MKMRIVAVGPDAYWLRAVQNALSTNLYPPETINCSSDIQECVAKLPKPDNNTLLLIDSSGQRDMEQFIAMLRARGWRYVVVIAADPSAKEATAVLRRNLSFDYWEKTYDEIAIKNRATTCIMEILADKTQYYKKHHEEKQ